MQLKQRPYHLLLLTWLALVIISFFQDKKKTIDIHFGDTYYVIAQSHVFIFFAFIVWTLWFLYLLTRKILYSKSLTWIHVSITVVTLLFLLCMLKFVGNIFTQTPGRYTGNNWNTFELYNRSVKWIFYITIALVLAQVIFIVNLVKGIVKRMN
jgi:hypothetical protein